MSTENPEMGLYLSGGENIAYHRDLGLPPKPLASGNIPPRPSPVFGTSGREPVVHFMDVATYWNNKEWGVDSPDSFLAEIKPHFDDHDNLDLRHGDWVSGLDKNGSFVTLRAFQVWGKQTGRPT